MLVQHFAGDAGLDHAVEILGVDFQHLVHVAQIDADAAGRRVDLTLQRGAGAERDHGNAARSANPHHVLDVRGLLRHHHCIRRLRRQPRGGVRMLVAHRFRGDEAVAEPGGERFDGGCQRLRFRTFQMIGDGYAHAISSRLLETVAKDIKGVKRPVRTKGWMMTTATAANDALTDMPLPPAPFLSSVMQIEPAWIDHNGHLNMAYYNVMF